MVSLVGIPQPFAAEPPSSARASTEKLAWISDPAVALAKARRAGKPLLVDVWAIWCAPCKQMDKTTWQDERVTTLANEFIVAKVDADLHKAFIERHQITVWPTILLFDDEGREITRVLGYIEGGALAGKLQRLKDGMPALKAVRERDGDPDRLIAAGHLMLALDDGVAAARYLRKAQRFSGRAPATVREGLALDIGKAEEVSGDYSAAAKAYGRLAEKTSDPKIKGAALVGVVRAERKRGRSEAAEEALIALKEAFPDLAREFE